MITHFQTQHWQQIVQLGLHLSVIMQYATLAASLPKTVGDAVDDAITWRVDRARSGPSGLPIRVDGMTVIFNTFNYACRLEKRTFLYMYYISST